MDITQTLQLVRCAQDGDAESLNRIVSRYFERVRAVVRARLGPKLRRWHDSGDVAQQTFIAAVQSLDQFEIRDDAAFISWLAKIAENQIRGLDAHMRADKRNADREVGIDTLAGTADDREGGFATEATGPAETAAGQEEQHILVDVIADLPEEYRELILLRDYVGHSWDEIAEQTGRPSGDAARMKYSTARSQLAAMVKQRLGGKPE